MTRTIAEACLPLTAIAAVLLTACKAERAPRAPDSAPDRASWTVADSGFGPIVVGMTAAEANTAVGGGLRLPESLPTEGCSYAQAPAADGLSLMIEEGRIVRIDVKKPGPTTSEGAVVGDTEERIQQIYAGRVTTSPHKYTDGHYLTVAPRQGSRGTTGLIFETDGRVVTQFRAGLLPQVAYVEGCG